MIKKWLKNFIRYCYKHLHLSFNLSQNNDLYSKCISAIYPQKFYKIRIRSPICSRVSKWGICTEHTFYFEFLRQYMVDIFHIFKRLASVLMNKCLLFLMMEAMGWCWFQSLKFLAYDNVVHREMTFNCL